MNDDQADDRPDADRKPPARPGQSGHVDHQETTPAQERGERIDTGKTIARGGKEHGHVPGGEESQKE